MRDYSRQPVAPDPLALVRRQVDQREDDWLRMVQRAVFSSESQPYRRMFELAGCTYGDLENAVRRDGLESTLEKLYDEGVYLSVDEFKGKAPIVRQGEEITSSPSDFQNRLEESWLDVATGGSSGSRTKVPYGTGSLLLRDCVSALTIREFDLGQHTRLILRPILPSSIGVMMGLSMSRMGQPMHHWFATGGSAVDSLHYRAVTRYLVHIGRLNGASMPTPQYLKAGDFTTPTQWIARKKEDGRLSMLSSFVSPAVRMAVLAQDRGWDIGGTIVIAGGETATAAKRQALQNAGMLYSSRYWISEIGPIGIGCRHMLNKNSTHLMHNTVAVISRRRPAPFAEGSVDALLFTSTSPLCASILINAEMGDTATLRPANCDCSLSQAGLGWAISDVSSYSKLTGQGMTLMGTDVVALLEEHLPQKFGGAPADYQLVERHGKEQTELELYVSPRVGVGDLEAVRREFVRSLRKIYGGSLATRVWEHSDGLRVLEREPFATPIGKVLPLHLAGGIAENRESHES